MKKPSDRNRRALPITYGAVRRIGLGHPLRRDPARVIHTNMGIRNGRSKPDISISLRIGHFYFAPTRSGEASHSPDAVATSAATVFDNFFRSRGRHVPFEHVAHVRDDALDVPFFIVHGVPLAWHHIAAQFGECDEVSRRVESWGDQFEVLERENVNRKPAVRSSGTTAAASNGCGFSARIR